MPGKTNGFCDKQDGGCTEYVKLEARMKGVETFVEKHEESQLWHRRMQIKTILGVYVAIGLIVLNFFKTLILG